MRSFHEWLGSNSSVAVAVGDSRTVTEVTALTSVWSAAAFTGRFSDSRISKRTVALLESNAPRQRRGRNGLTGVRAKSGASRGRIGPWAERLYAVDPAGVAIMTPSQFSSS